MFYVCFEKLVIPHEVVLSFRNVGTTGKYFSIRHMKCSEFQTGILIQWEVPQILVITVAPRSMDTRLLRTPGYYRQFRLSRRKAHIFSLKLTRLIRTLVNTDNGHFSVSRVTNSHSLSTPLYGRFISVYCRFSTFRKLKAPIQRKVTDFFKRKRVVLDNKTAAFVIDN